MRHLLYYPCVPYSDESELEERMHRDIAKTNLPKDFLQHLQREKIRSLKIHNRMWQDFVDYLKGQEPFDRVYAAGNLHNYWSGEGSGINSCLGFLEERGDMFEDAENETLLALGDLVRKVPTFFKWVNHFRENGATKRIDETLKEDERGLLLYGIDHERTLVQKLGKLDLQLEVYPQTELRIELYTGHAT